MAIIQKSKLELKNLLLGLGVILLVVAGFFYFKNRQEGEVLPPAEEIIVEEEGTVKKTGEIVQPLTDEEIEAMREEIDGILATGGETISLTDLVGDQAGGEAKRAFSDGKFYYRLMATNLALVEKGYYYEGWLKKDEDYLSVGRLEVDTWGRGILYYTASVDRSDYSQVLVTLEPEDGDSTPATPFLEGNF